MIIVPDELNFHSVNIMLRLQLHFSLVVTGQNRDFDFLQSTIWSNNRQFYFMVAFLVSWFLNFSFSLSRYFQTILKRHATRTFSGWAIESARTNSSKFNRKTTLAVKIRIIFHFSQLFDFMPKLCMAELVFAWNCSYMFYPSSSRIWMIRISILSVWIL